MRGLLFVFLKTLTFFNHCRKSYLLCQVIYMNFLKENNPDYSLEGLMLKLGHLMQRADSFIKTLILAKTEGRRRRG